MTDEKVKVGNWVAWKIEVFKGLDPLISADAPVSVQVHEEGRVGEVVETMEGGCVVMPLAMDDRPLVLQDGQYRIITR